MAKELLVNVSRGEEVRVALVEDGRLEEIYLERDSAASNVGNIYLGKVTNVEGSIQAAFVDFGYGRNGFLHVQDLHPDYFPDGGRWDRMTERVGKKIGRRDRPPIQDCLRRGDQIIVQIIKEGIGTKGPTLTSYPSIPGRFLVMMPGVEQMGVSKNIEDETERRRLRKVLDGLKPPKGAGFIIRTAGMGKTKAELERDFKYLTRLFEQIEHHKKNARPPTLLYSEGDLVTRTVRDVWTSDVDRVVCDDPETALRIKQFFRLLMPRTKVNVQLYQGHVPLFHAAGVEQEIETMFSRHVPLPSGGSLVIDSTEAVVAIDVNSGKFRDHADAEETAFRTDMEAAEEICRQLRLRDLGGVVIVDFIDLRYSRHREALFNKLTDLFKRDKAKSRHLPMNEFGIVSITRQRMRPDLKKSVFMPCPWSGGTGYIKTPESMALDVMRRLRVATADAGVRRVNVRLFPSVALHVLNVKRQALADLERVSGKTITLRQDEDLAADEVAMELYDDRDGQVQLEALRAPAAAAAAGQPDSGGKRRRRRRRGGERDEAQPATTRKAGAAPALIDLPDLLELGELKVDEVEKLVDKLVAQDNAARKAVEHDPQKAILEALQSGALAEEAEDEEAIERPEPAAPAPRTAPAASEGDGAAGGRRRRRRRDGRDARPSAADTGASALEAEDGAGDEQEVQVGRRDAATGAPAEEPARGGRRRRGRRRGRAGGGRDEAPVETGRGAAPVRPGAPMPRREPFGAHHDEPTDRLADRDRVGATVERTSEAAPARSHGGSNGRPSQGFEGEGGGGRRRRRRGRKGRGLRGQGPGEAAPQAAAPRDPHRLAVLSDDQLDDRLNGNRLPPAPARPAPGVNRDTAEATGHSPHIPASPGDADEPRGRRRRRRRRRGGADASQQPAGAPAAARFTEQPEASSGNGIEAHPLPATAELYGDDKPEEDFGEPANGHLDEPPFIPLVELPETELDDAPSHGSAGAKAGEPQPTEASIAEDQAPPSKPAERRSRRKSVKRPGAPSPAASGKAAKQPKRTPSK